MLLPLRPDALHHALDLILCEVSISVDERLAAEKIGAAEELKTLIDGEGELPSSEVRHRLEVRRRNERFPQIRLLSLLASLEFVSLPRRNKRNMRIHAHLNSQPSQCITDRRINRNECSDMSAVAEHTAQESDLTRSRTRIGENVSVRHEIIVDVKHLEVLQEVIRDDL
jgi:hypothetical protein